VESLARKLVVAALVTDERGRVLLSQRKPDQPMGGLWELPGGKVEPGEAPAAALAREVEEELGCTAQVGAVYEVVHFLYPRFELVMIVYRTELVGTPQTRQVARLAWVAPAALPSYEVLAADVALLRGIAERGSVDLVPAGPPPPSASRRSFETLTRDTRSGGLNAHYLRLRIDEELDRSARYTRPLSLILVDVDDLGAVNDRHGRAAADEVLAQLVVLMTRNARTIDRVGRWSGGGFALLLPETPTGAAFGIAERLRADIAARRFAAPGVATGSRLELRCTVSCGVASTRGGATPETSSLPARADAALWRAKVAGRNRTVVDSEGSAGGA